MCNEDTHHAWSAQDDSKIVYQAIILFTSNYFDAGKLFFSFDEGNAW